MMSRRPVARLNRGRIRGRGAAPSPVSITSPAPGTELKANVAQSITVEGVDGDYDLVIAGQVRGTVTVSGGTGTDDITPTADDIGQTQIAVRASGGSTNLDTLAVSAVRWRHLYEFFTPADILWHNSARFATVESGRVASIQTRDGDGDPLPALDQSHATEANRPQYIASDPDFGGLPSAHAADGTQWLFNADETVYPYPITRIIVGMAGTGGASHALTGGNESARSCGTLIAHTNGAPGGTVSLFNGSTLVATGIDTDRGQPGIWISNFNTASATRQVLRDGSDESGPEPAGNAGTGGLRGCTLLARVDGGTLASANIGAKFHEELVLSAPPSTAQIDAMLADWRTRPGWLSSPLPKTTFGSATKVVESAQYTAHPYGSLRYDAVRDKVWGLYNDGDAHGYAPNNGVVMYYEINTTTDAFENTQGIIDVDDLTGVEAPNCLCSGITAQGDYLALVKILTSGSVVAKVYALRSTDGGSTWVNEGDLLDTEGGIFTETARQGPPHDFFLTASGTILCGYRDLINQRLDIIRSTDHGAHWSLITCDNGNIPNTEPLEPAFWQHPTSGRIIAFIRPGNSNNETNPLLSYSDDDGLTWSPFELSRWPINYYNPSTFVDLGDGTVEVYCGDRSQHPSDSQGSIWRMIATYDGAVLNAWSRPDRLFTMTPSSADAGYPAACRVGSKVYLVWYDEEAAGDSDIWMAVGTAQS